MFHKLRSFTSQRRFLSFVGLTFLLSWLCWIPAALSGQDVNSGNFLLFYVLGGFGPSISGIIMISFGEDKETRHEFWKRVVDFRRISPNWFLFALLVFPTVFVTATSFGYLTGAPAPELPRLEQIVAAPLMLVSIVLAGILTGPLSEELGWRGFALDQLQNRWSPLVASLILAPVWWAWHLPLFFMRGTTQYKWGVGSLDFWLFFAAILPLTLLLTWAYNQNRHSVLLTVFMHFMYNFSLGMVYPLSQTANIYHIGGMYVAAIAVLISTARQGAHIGLREHSSTA